MGVREKESTNFRGGEIKQNGKNMQRKFLLRNNTNIVGLSEKFFFQYHNFHFDRFLVLVGRNIWK